ncbi:Uncharacterized membrane protein [Tistlia consotensis]|uniref:Uncharacterized membrane protein n=1 Tax=Tistlia consotensis USBA 355 TaxID=560819 RepID=A0A1Y6BAI1_9PROT|nr:AzlD domain-containing protein [Tistlia consotensis]SME90377.1 Uncharacterized membrane protein [Tistlia consotensis USBA 355]SNR26699.1 Uncharacterized membrane protein [Tistlia consotensis]
MTLDPQTLLAILGMALVTYATRLGGWLMVRRYTPTGRAAAALEAVPGAILTAVIAPMVLATGPAETAAAVLTVLAFLKVPRLAAVIFGVLCVVALRALLG